MHLILQLCVSLRKRTPEKNSLESDTSSQNLSHNFSTCPNRDQRGKRKCRKWHNKELPPGTSITSLSGRIWSNPSAPHWLQYRVSVSDTHTCPGFAGCLWDCWLGQNVWSLGHLHIVANKIMAVFRRSHWTEFIMPRSRVIDIQMNL